jgi:hypothetical protein
MRRRFLLGWSLAAMCLAMPGIAANSVAGEQFVGVWLGTWEGGGAGGKFDVTLAKGADGKLTGSVAVVADAGNYDTKFSSLSFDGDKMTAKYDYPPDVSGEIALTATFGATEANGTWALQPKGTTEAFANGTFTVKKK